MKHILYIFYFFNVLYLCATPIATGLQNPTLLCLSTNDQYLYFSEDGLNIKRIDLTDPAYPITTMISEADMQNEFGMNYYIDNLLVYYDSDDLGEFMQISIGTYMYDSSINDFLYTTDIYELINPETYTYSATASPFDISNYIYGAAGSYVVELPANKYYTPDISNPSDNYRAFLGVDVDNNQVVLEKIHNTTYVESTDVFWNLNFLTPNNLYIISRSRYVTYYVERDPSVSNSNLTNKLVQLSENPTDPNNPVINYYNYRFPDETIEVNNAGYSALGVYNNPIYSISCSNCLGIPTYTSKVVKHNNDGTTEDVVTGVNTGLDLAISSDESNLYYSQAGAITPSNNVANNAPTGSIHLVPLVSLAVEDVNQENFSIEISPNPVEDYFSIKSEESIKTIEIFDLNGKLLNTIKNPDLNSISAQKLKSGIYILKMITEDNKEISSKLIKK